MARTGHVPWRPRPNVAKRARALGIMRRKGIKPRSAEAIAACKEAIEQYLRHRAACAAAAEAKP